MELVLSTNRTTPVIYRLGTSDAIGTFTANEPSDNGGKPAISINPGGGVNIKFKVNPIQANTEGKITLRPLGGVCTSANWEIGFVTPLTINKKILTFNLFFHTCKVITFVNEFSFPAYSS
jgi:hypothetical protein